MLQNGNLKIKKFGKIKPDIYIPLPPCIGCLGQQNILHCKNLLLCPNMWKHPSTPLGFTVWWLALVLWFHLWQFYWVNFHFFFCRNKLLDWCWRRRNKLIKKSCPCVPLSVVPRHLSTWSTCYSVDLSYVTPSHKTVSSRNCQGLSICAFFF